MLEMQIADYLSSCHDAVRSRDGLDASLAEPLISQWPGGRPLVEAVRSLSAALLQEADKEYARLVCQAVAQWNECATPSLPSASRWASDESLLQAVGAACPGPSLALTPLLALLRYLRTGQWDHHATAAHVAFPVDLKAGSQGRLLVLHLACTDTPLGDLSPDPQRAIWVTRDGAWRAMEQAAWQHAPARQSNERREISVVWWLEHSDPKKPAPGPETVLEGGSAGGAFLVGIQAALTGTLLNPDQAVSLGLGANGQILPVGGVEAKAVALRDESLDLVTHPDDRDSFAAYLTAARVHAVSDVPGLLSALTDRPRRHSGADVRSFADGVETALPPVRQASDIMQTVHDYRLPLPGRTYLGTPADVMGRTAELEWLPGGGVQVGLPKVVAWVGAWHTLRGTLGSLSELDTQAPLPAPIVSGFQPQVVGLSCGVKGLGLLKTELTAALPDGGDRYLQQVPRLVANPEQTDVDVAVDPRHISLVRRVNWVVEPGSALEIHHFSLILRFAGGEPPPLPVRLALFSLAKLLRCWDSEVGLVAEWAHSPAHEAASVTASGLFCLAAAAAAEMKLIPANWACDALRTVHQQIRCLSRNGALLPQLVTKAPQQTKASPVGEPAGNSQVTTLYAVSMLLAAHALHESQICREAQETYGAGLPTGLVQHMAALPYGDVLTFLLLPRLGETLAPNEWKIRMSARRSAWHEMRRVGGDTAAGKLGLYGWSPLGPPLPDALDGDPTGRLSVIHPTYMLQTADLHREPQELYAILEQAPHLLQPLTGLADAVDAADPTRTLPGLSGMLAAVEMLAAYRLYARVAGEPDIIAEAAREFRHLRRDPRR